MIVPLSQPDRELAAFIARIRNAKAGKVRDRKVNPFRSDIEVHFLGALAEIAVAKVLGVDVDTRQFPGGDGGIDLEYNGHTIQVKFNSHKHGDLYFNTPADFSADLAVLVVPETADSLFIAGWITKAEFEDRMFTANFGYGDRVCVGQADLFPMKILTDERKSANVDRRAVG